MAFHTKASISNLIEHLTIELGRIPTQTQVGERLKVTKQRVSQLYKEHGISASKIMKDRQAAISQKRRDRRAEIAQYRSDNPQLRQVDVAEIFSVDQPYVSQCVREAKKLRELTHKTA